MAAHLTSRWGRLGAALGLMCAGACGGEGGGPTTFPRPDPWLDACVRDAACLAPLAVSHRGEGGGEPENTVASVHSAVEQGADVVEVDIRTTADGVWVLMHDGTVTRTITADSNETGKTEVDEMTYAEIQTLVVDDHLGRCVDPAAAGFQARCRVPSLADVLDAARGRILVMLDWKGGAATSLGQLLVAEDATSFAFAFDSDVDELEIAEAEAPGLSIMPRAKSVAEVEALLARRPFDMIHVDTGYLASLPREYEGRPVKYFVDVFIEVDLYAASHELSGNPEELEQARANYLGVLDAGAFMTQADHAYLMREWIDDWRR